MGVGIVGVRPHSHTVGLNGSGYEQDQLRVRVGLLYAVAAYTCGRCSGVAHLKPPVLQVTVQAVSVEAGLPGISLPRYGGGGGGAHGNKIEGRGSPMPWASAASVVLGTRRWSSWAPQRWASRRPTCLYCAQCGPEKGRHTAHAEQDRCERRCSWGYQVCALAPQSGGEHLRVGQGCP